MPRADSVPAAPAAVRGSCMGRMVIRCRRCALPIIPLARPCASIPPWGRGRAGAFDAAAPHAPTRRCARRPAAAGSPHRGRHVRGAPGRRPGARGRAGRPREAAAPPISGDVAGRSACGRSRPHPIGGRPGGPGQGNWTPDALAAVRVRSAGTLASPPLASFWPRPAAPRLAPSTAPGAALLRPWTTSGRPWPLQPPSGPVAPPAPLRARA